MLYLYVLSICSISMLYLYALSLYSVSMFYFCALSLFSQYLFFIFIFYLYALFICSLCSVSMFLLHALSLCSRCLRVTVLAELEGLLALFKLMGVFVCFLRSQGFSYIRNITMIIISILAIIMILGSNHDRIINKDNSKGTIKMLVTDIETIMHKCQ